MSKQEWREKVRDTKTAIAYALNRQRHEENIQLATYAMWFAGAAVVVSLIFGVWDAFGDRAWQADQLELLQDISAKLDQQQRLDALTQKQRLLDEQVRQIGNDLKSLQ